MAVVAVVFQLSETQGTYNVDPPGNTIKLDQIFMVDFSQQVKLSLGTHDGAPHQHCAHHSKLFNESIDIQLTHSSSYSYNHTDIGCDLPDLQQSDNHLLDTIINSVLLNLASILTE